MPLQQLFTSRKGYSADTFVANDGKLFYDEATGQLRLGDGHTPGGLPIPFTIATDTVVGGIKAGPGVIINSEGQIIIDSTGLEFSFGDFQGDIGTYPADYFELERQSKDYAVLNSIKSNEDIVVATNGTGAVRIVGDFSVRRANGSLTGALEEQPIFRVKSDGQVQMLVPGADSTQGAVGIVGGLDGVFQAPVNTGVMLHVTGIAGTPGIPSRIYNDAQNAFSAYVARRYNGTSAAPTAVFDGEEIMRLSGTAHNGTEIPGSGNQRIVYKALGNQTPTNQGGTMEFWATALNTTTLTKIATVDSTGITLESGKVLTGNVTGTATRVSQALTIGTHLTGTSYDGSSAVTIATDATTTATANVLVARDSNGLITAQNYKGNTRDAGTLTAGATLTINYATDHHVLVNITGAITIAHQNITAGRNVKVVVINATGGNLAVNTGLADINTTGNNAAANLNARRMGTYEFISFGTTTTTLYASINK